MTRVSQWEDKFLKIERTIFELSKIAAHLPDSEASSETIVDRDRIDEALAQISVCTARASQACKTTQDGTRSNAAIGYWGKQLALKIKSVADEYVALQNRKMWLRILQARFTGQSNQDTADLHAKHLVDIVSRKRNLAQLETSLRRDLTAASCERDILRLEYEAIAIADQNWSASGSFQARLGKNLDHARKNPSACAFSDGLKILALPNRFPEESLWLRQKNESLSEKSKNLSSHGNRIASELSKGTGHADKLSVTKFRTALDQVVAMNLEVTAKLQSLLAKSPIRSRPKIVQNH